MANPNKKFKENIPGKYYVDQNCIGCTICAELAPNNFKMNTAEETDYINDYVYKQPENPEECSACEEAIQICPANAIGNDGMEE